METEGATIDNYGVDSIDSGVFDAKRQLVWGSSPVAVAGRIP